MSVPATAWLLAIAVGITIGFGSSLVGSVYLHRGLCHRQVAFDRRFEQVLWFALVWMLGVNPRKWVAVHRLHHRFADSDSDPHTPAHNSFARIIVGTGGIVRNFDPETAREIAPDVSASPAIATWAGPMALIAVLITLFGPTRGSLVTASWIVIAKLSGGIVAVWGHTERASGIRRFGPQNRPILALLTWGEGFHKNHHDRPRRANLATGRGVDLGYLVLRALCRAGLATVPTVYEVPTADFVIWGSRGG